MPDLYLDLRDRPATLDFIANTVEYLAAVDPLRREAESLAHEIEKHESVSQDELAELARKVGRAAWSARAALRHYVTTPNGADDEFKRIASAVSASTGHLLERFRRGTRRRSLTDVLNDAESAAVFGDRERIEIESVRTHVLPVIWNEKRKDLAKAQHEADETLRQIEDRLRALRDLAFSSPELEGEITSKLERLEDRLYFEGETLDTDRLDEDLGLYREEKALPASFDREVGRRD
jgi:hypothetical protein